MVGKQLEGATDTLPPPVLVGRPPLSTARLGTGGARFPSDQGVPCVSAAGTMSEPSREARPIPRGSRACRRLFGPVDSEQLQRDCDALMASCVQEACDRWNFDFVTETPLDGDFAWERVWSLDLPKLYLPSGPRRAQDSLGRSKRSSSSPALLQGTAQEDHVDLSLSCTLVPRSPEQPEGSPGGPSASQGRKRRQTSMTGEARCRE